MRIGILRAKLTSSVGLVFSGEIGRKRRHRVIAACVACFVTAYGGFVISGLYACRFLDSELERVVSRIESKWGVSVRIGGSGFHPFFGMELRDLVIFGAEEINKPFLSASRMRIHYRPCLVPKPGLRISGVTLVDPKLILSMHSGQDPDWLASLTASRRAAWDFGRLESLAGAAGRFLIVGPDVTLAWKNGRVVVASHQIFDGDSLPVITHSSGEMDYNLISRRMTLTAKARIAEAKGDIRVQAKGDMENLKISLGSRGVELAGLVQYFPPWLSAGDGAEFMGSVETLYAADEPVQSFHFNWELRGVGLHHRYLAQRPIRDVHFHSRGTVQWNRAKRKIRFVDSRIGIGTLVADMEGSIDYAASPRIETRLRRHSLPIRDIMKGLPPDFIPTIHNADVAGTVDADIVLAMDMSGRRPVEFEPAVVVRDFQVISAPRADIDRLKYPFLHRVRKNGRVVKEFWVGPSNPDFTPYGRMGNYTIRAILTCEDGRFFSHGGFQLKHIRQSLEQNIREKRFARGASTISMQTVKNLFLGNEKSLSRKFEEMLLTYALEQALTKERIMEIYLNIIEWGPGIYGIGAASRHYFDKRPDKLSPVEAAYLASIIANPIRYHTMYRQGKITDSWSNYLSVIISKMNLDEKEITEVRSTKPEFAWVRKKGLNQEGAGGGVPVLQGEIGKTVDGKAPL
ncbi:MAG: Biosynthetic peptidoglycan transglycosylase [Syntrophus sp. SKADARSKE-3]|nr:Biosynthetic peptidoglycan transglycosylase [Syntrophus sp. SKADARSKE-3]